MREGGRRKGGLSGMLGAGGGGGAEEQNGKLCQCRQTPRRWRACSTPDEAPPHGQDQQ